MLESTVEEHLCTQVAKHGGRCDKVIDLTRIGGPDREAQWPLRLGGGLDKIELKKPGEKPKAHQTRYHEYLASCGVPVYLIDTKEKVHLYVTARVNGYAVPELWSVNTEALRDALGA